ncbi:MAG TPA: hypothetical protein VK807_01095 [Gemmatimonadaceae bacterium]|jgi:hypothetical protein|nr:hypothetical protein [Gemmatimonadaceae bacterium]
MMLVERGLLAITMGFATFAIVGWCASVPRGATTPRAGIGDVADVGGAAAESIDAAARVVAATDPFRLDRHPASVAYRPDLEGVAPPPKPPKPQLVLEGLVGGAALIDGAPGHPATTIVHVGDTLGGLRIRRVGRDTVIVTGADTTWRLTLRRAWQ